MIGETKLVVVPQVENDCEYDVWIDGVYRSNYQFIKKSDQYGYIEIKIDIKKGDLKINNKLCWALYSTKDDNILPLKQLEYCDWFYGLNCKVNKWYNGPMTLNFYHLFLQGPSYFNGINPVYNYKQKLFGDPNYVKLNTNLLKKELGLRKDNDIQKM